MTCADAQAVGDEGRFSRWRALVLTAAVVLQGTFGFFKYDEPAGDALEYQALAVAVLDHHTFALDAGGPAAPGTPTARRMPLYPFFVALLYAATGNDETSYLVVAPVQSLLMVCAIALLMAVARRFFGDGPALIAGVLAVLYQPYLFYLPTQMISETLYLTLLLLAVYLLTRRSVHRLTSLMGGFGVLGAVILTRANAVFLVPVALGWAWQTLSGVGGRWKKMLLLLVCLSLPLVPWWARNAITFDRFIPFSTNGGLNFYLGHNEGYRRSPDLSEGVDYAIFDRLVRGGYSEIEADRELYTRGLSYARSRPAETCANLLRKAVVVFSVTTLQTWNIACLILVVVGIRAARSSRVTHGLILGGHEASPPPLRRRAARGGQADTRGGEGDSGPPPLKTQATGLRRATWSRWETLLSRRAGAVLIVLGAVLWVGQAWTVLHFHNRGLAGVGISFGLLGILAFIGLVIAFRRSCDHWILPALFIAQIAACLVYIPIVRIRWTVDFVVIMYAAVAIRAFADRLVQRC